MGGESVRVAVRVRPFNSREKDRNAKLIIAMNGAATSITNPENGESKTFTFDFSYWSHSDFEDQDGLLVPTSDKYADQKRVMSELGKDVLDNAYKGYNCSLFAYGQTGSGKSYSMVGYGINKGIVPQTCDAIFTNIEANTDEKKKYRVAVSMLEIYNEQVRDLFSKNNPKGGLKVRQHPKLGVQVVGLQEIAVNSYKEIDRCVEQGTANRTVASTNMNATSSRAHTVVAISYTQIVIDGKGPGKNAEQSSRINLVDLAGSERAESTGATGDRLKEGSAINLSLTMLGNVITALAERSNNPKKKVLIPYRDSKLTMILQDALGGNSKTIMIAALSPADINYEETLSTLRYADRAKKIKNNAVVNVDPTEALIKKLKEENAKLLKQLQQMGGGELPPDMEGEGGGGGITEEDKAAMRAQIEAELKQAMQENMAMLEDADMSWDDRVARDQALVGAMDAEAVAKASKQNKVPHLVNLNEDVALSNVIFHFLEKDTVAIGRKDPKKDIQPDVPLSGLSIKVEHAEIRKEGDGFVLAAMQAGKDACKVFHNGEQLKANEPKPLTTNDRILFGNNHMYLFVDPEVRNRLAAEYKDQGDDTAEKPPGIVNWDWEMAQTELARARGVEIGSNVDTSHMSPAERRQQQLQDQLLSILPLLNEANDIALELEKGVQFETLLLSKYSQGELKTEINIKMKAIDGATFWIWDTDKFINRVYLMRENYNNLLEYGDEYAEAEVKPEDDPFYDPKQKVLIGQAQVLFASVVHMVEQDILVNIKGSSKNSEGSLQVAITPVKPDGTAIDDDDDEFEIDEPTELLGRRLDFRVKIPYARGLSPNYLKDVHCQFRLEFLSNEVEYTKSVTGTINPEFHYDKQFTVPSVDQNTLDYFQNEMLNIEVWGETAEEIVHSGRRRGSVTGVKTPSRPSTPETRRRSSVHMQGMGDLQLKKHLDEVSREYEEKAKAAQDQVNFLKEETQLQSQKLDKKEEQLRTTSAQLQKITKALEVGEVCGEISTRVVQHIRTVLAADNPDAIPDDLEIVDVTGSADPAVANIAAQEAAQYEQQQQEPAAAPAPAPAPVASDSGGAEPQGVVPGDGGAKSQEGKAPESKACTIL